MRFHNDPFPFIAQDSWRGSILEYQKGSNGFGYDPLFYLPNKGMTAAELDSKEKHKISHRGKALKNSIIFSQVMFRPINIKSSSIVFYVMNLIMRQESGFRNA